MEKHYGDITRRQLLGAMAAMGAATVGAGLLGGCSSSRNSSASQSSASSTTQSESASGAASSSTSATSASPSAAAGADIREGLSLLGDEAQTSTAQINAWVSTTV